MKLDKEVVLERYKRTEQLRTPYILLAEEYERMWRGDPGFEMTRREALAKGHEQVVVPTPFNVVNLSQRLLSTQPRISVIPQDVSNKKAVEYSEQCEKWLTALWKRINKDQKRNVLADAIWYALVRGKFAFEVKWVKEALPKLRQKTQLPISIRALDPINVGSWSGPLYTEWVYHKYETSLLEVVRRWPELKKAPAGTQFASYLDRIDKVSRAGEDITVEVVDYWYVSEKDGSIWNCVLVEDEFAKEPMQTDYPDLPIVVGRGDYGVNMGEEWDGMSILHPLRGLWQYQCRLASQMATGLLWHFWPAIIVENAEGEEIGDIEVGPGITTPVPTGTKVTLERIDPNVPLAQAVYGQVEGYVQQSTYPEVMYGRQPGELQAGYGISLLSDAARGRIKNFAESLEMVVGYVNSFVLALVEVMAGEEGVDILGVDDRDGDKLRLTLNKQIINGNYENEVLITPNLPSDDQARVTMGLRINESKKISDQTFRDKFLDVQVPSDEQKRISMEEAMQSDEMRPYRLRKALEEYFGPADALAMMYGTDLMPEPPAGYHWMQKVVNGPVTLMADADMGPGPGEGPQGPPPDDMMMDPMMGPAGPGPIQPEGFQGPMGGNLMAPAEMGMIEPEMLGLPPAGNPMVFDEMMGTRLPPQEELDMLGGM